MGLVLDKTAMSGFAAQKAAAVVYASKGDQVKVYNAPKAPACAYGNRCRFQQAASTPQAVAASALDPVTGDGKPDLTAQGMQSGRGPAIDSKTGGGSPTRTPACTTSTIGPQDGL